MTAPGPGAGAPRVEVKLGGRRVSLSNLDKVLWPRLGLTKASLIEHYARVAPVMLTHVAGHPVTLHRFPDGVDGPHWYETRAPAHPAWVRTVTFRMRRTGKEFDVVVIDDAAALVWAAQIGAVEIHPYLAGADDLDRPAVMVFDLDPGPPATLADCCRVAVWVRELLATVGLEAWPKTSGGLGLHVYVPLHTPVTYEGTKAFARAVARLLERDRPDLVILDLMLPRLDGLEVFRRIRAQASTPVIMLTAKGDETDRVVGLEIGADDYVVKPFSPREILARVTAVLRRSARSQAEDPAERAIDLGWLRLDSRPREASADGVPLSLTPREFDLLHFLAIHPRAVFTRDQLLAEVWDLAFDGDPSTVTVHVRRLREKIEADPSRPRRLITVWGRGYRLEP